MIADLDKLMKVHQIGNGSRRSFESLNLSNRSFKPHRPSIEDPPMPELKPLLVHLKYTYLGDNNTFPVVISIELTEDQEAQLLEVLRRSKKALGWLIADIKGISPTICIHKIILEDCHGKSIEKQKRLNPIMKEVVKTEIIKWLDVGIYTQFLIVLGMKGLYGYRKISNATRKDHFPLPFIDQMLDRLVGKAFYYFLDGYSGYCLQNLELGLSQSQEINLVLNWEKCHFMVSEGIVLRYKVSQQGITIDKAKIEVIEKFPPPTSVKSIRSFLGHVDSILGLLRNFPKYSNLFAHFWNKTDLLTLMGHACKHLRN
ncbi:uncharacterized protein [Gossypium hirsutum]|uniref:RNA-directed DNA polymerase homolog n=1 Tax=Gossypium hirsutum TaxID=3635 RepID=A0A1U8ISP4_GOSHI|nr:uncharacterized protein LOC107899859 [Gossypium hirsutum]